MKHIFTISALCPLLFFSCQNTSQSTEAKDSLLQATSDTAALPKMEAVEVASIDTVKNTPTTDDFDDTYEGTLNGKIKVKVNIFQYNSTLRARAVYLSSKKIIDMDVVYPSVRHYKLTEKVNGKPTGIWNIYEDEDGVFVGTWSAPDGSKQMPIRLTTSTEAFDSFLPAEEVKTGHYVYEDINEDEETKEEFPITYSEDLHVRNMSGNSIAFELYIQGPPPGVHIGMLDAIAYKAGKNYVYKNDEGCEITMSFVGDSVKLNQEGTDVNCGFGANIGAFGTLKRSRP